VLIIIGIFLGAGEKRKIVVFSNFNDLGLTFLIPASLLLILTQGENHCLFSNIPLKLLKLKEFIPEKAFVSRLA
jgi:hypothetical protein